MISLDTQKKLASKGLLRWLMDAEVLEQKSPDESQLGS